MTEQAQLATDILVYATIGMDLVVVILVLLSAFAHRALRSFLDRWNICTRCIAFLVSAFALCGSVLYSVVTGFQGCALCLSSRIIMGLIAVTLFSSAFIRGEKERMTILIGKILAALGILVSGYQYLLQWLALTGTHLPCPAVEGLPSCDRIYFIEFGFITIPFVALSAFTLILVLLFLYRSPTSDIKAV